MSGAYVSLPALFSLRSSSVISGGCHRAVLEVARGGGARYRELADRAAVAQALPQRREVAGRPAQQCGPALNADMLSAGGGMGWR